MEAEDLLREINPCHGPIPRSMGEKMKAEVGRVYEAERVASGIPLSHFDAKVPKGIHTPSPSGRDP